MASKDSFVNSGIIAQGLADQGFEGIHYFQSMRSHKKKFGAIVQTNVESITENFEKIGAVVSSKLIELRKSPSPALVEEIPKLENFKEMKQHIVSTTVTESQMTIKYLKNVSAMVTGVSTVTEVDLGVPFLTVHWDLAAHYLNKETKGLLAHFAQAPSDIHTVKDQQKLAYS